jgi:glycerophosphoryl diester phosphodiesterase
MRTGIIAALTLSVSSAASAQPRFQFFDPVQPARQTQVMAHRGLHTLAPENSPAAVLACASDYIEWAKVDVRLTRDGHHIVVHDETVDRCSDGKGKVAELTLEEIKWLDAGSWFAPRFKGTRFSSLPELLTAAKGKVNLCFDCKSVDEARLVKEILAADMGSQVIVYCETGLAKKVLATAGDKVPVMVKCRPKMTVIDTFLQQLTPAAVEVDAEEITPEVCTAFHGHGVRVEAKVLGEKRDNAAVWGRLFEAGVDWVQTDNPAGVRFAEVRRRIPRFPVQISYHRGACRYAPENTIASIEQAAALGADYIEVDIRPTSEGRYMLLHDSTLDRTTGVKKPIRKAPFEEVVKLSAGSWFGRPFAGEHVPTLDAGLSAMGKQSHGYLDAKDITPADLLSAMQTHGLVERSVVYQSAQYLAKLKALEPKVRPLPPLGQTDQFDRVAAIGPYGVDASWSILSRELIAKSHNAGIKVFSDSLSPEHEKVEEYQKAMDWGIDVIQTNHPLRVLRAIELFKPTAP